MIGGLQSSQTRMQLACDYHPKKATGLVQRLSGSQRMPASGGLAQSSGKFDLRVLNANQRFRLAIPPKQEAVVVQ